ncbi:MOSC domain-containing protein [Spirosoma fluminis]
MTISELRIYPIKSLGGISVTEAVVEEKGLQYDRRFMLVQPSAEGDDSWTFITQRTNHHMALIDVAIEGDTLRVWHRDTPDDVLELPLTGPTTDNDDVLRVTIWDSKGVPAVSVSSAVDRWFTKTLGIDCRLVFMPSTTRREVDLAYARQHDVVSFADGYPFLLIGQASLDYLNQRLPVDSPRMSMTRFRPNIIVSGTSPYDEDAWDQFRVEDMNFYGVKPCARCVLTTIDPATGKKGSEPLKTLATYRQWKHKILFGQNVLPATNARGVLRVGQPIEVISRQQPWLTAPAPLDAILADAQNQ